MKKKNTNKADLFNQEAEKKEVKLTKEISKGCQLPEVKELVYNIRKMSEELKHSKSGVFYKSKS